MTLDAKTEVPPQSEPRFEAGQVALRRPRRARATRPQLTAEAEQLLEITRGIAAEDTEAAPRLGDGDESEALAPVKDLEHREKTYRRLLACADSLGAFAATMLVATHWGIGFKWAFLLVPVLAMLIAKIQGLYDRDDMVIRKATVIEWRLVLRAAALTGIAAYFVWYASTQSADTRGIRVFAALVVGSFVLTLPLRAVARRLARRLTTDERCLIIGEPAQCVTLANQIGGTEGVDLIGTVSTDHVDCSVAGVRELVEQLGVHRIVVGPHGVSGEGSTMRLIRSAKWLGVRLSLMPTVMTVVGATTAVDELDSMILLGVPRFGLSRSSRALKRTLDLVGGTVTLAFAAPVMIIVALAVKLDSDGSVLFRQQRIGRGGKAFTMYKFRSMVNDAEQRKAELADQNQTAGLFKLVDDPRITRVGHFLRRTYLDELPQLFNVLRGEMSLVGPRPLIESEDAMLTGYDRHRSRLTPGMTGPWQLRGPINASLPELAKLDYLYASNWSIWADIDILLGTAARVLRRHGH